MKKADQHSPGDVFQILPEYEQFGWVGAFFQAAEIKSWGVIGFVHMLKTPNGPPGFAYNRIKWENLHYVGKAAMLPDDKEEEEG